MRKCAVCGREFNFYVPIEEKYVDKAIKCGRKDNVRSECLNKLEYSCPFCFSSDRDRMIIMFIKMLHSKINQGIDFLEIAPSGSLQRYLYKNWGTSNLYSADLFMDGVDYLIDIQDMHEISDHTFDLIVCSHVLEHVQDDRKAMSELYRILDNRGLGIIMVPIDLNRDYTDEEWGLSETENWKRFGQGDHVRAYSKADYISRLKNSGFGVHLLDKSFFYAKEFEENALTDTATLYLVYKNETLYGTSSCVIDNFARIHQNIEMKRSFTEAIGEYDYWIDVCEIKENQLTIWGWLYLLGSDSKRTKFKLMLEGESNEYIYGINIRKREDIQEHFGSEKMDYSFSGIDVCILVDDIEHDTYNISLLVSNATKRHKIEIKRRLTIG